MAKTVLAQAHMAIDHSPVKGTSKLVSILGILAAASAAAPCFFSRAESLASAMRGSSDGAAWLDRLSAAGYAVAGLPGADAARALSVAAPVLSAFFALSWIAEKFAPTQKRWACCGLGVAAFVVIGFGTFQSYQAWQRDIRDIRLLAPVELLQTDAGGKERMFLNSPALAAARLLAPQIVLRAPDASTIPILSTSPVLWREAHRESPFTTVLLATPLDGSRQLVEMLSATPEWHLARIDNQGLLYRRGAAEAQNLPAQQVFSNKRDSAIRDAQTAMVMHFLGKNKNALDLMESARRNAPSDSIVLTQAATLGGALNQWPSAKRDAEAALREDSASIRARYLLALALLETGNISRAASEAATLSAQNSSDPSVLWLTARISREANDPTAEIAALDQLLTLAKNQKEPPTLIHIHLAQAWAKRGFATQALANYNAALKGDLTPQQRMELENAKGTIQDRAPRH
jgi:tetratricopeptide (TPR) repeat protein